MVDEIREPRYPWLIFGDGLQGQLINEKRDIDTDGTEVVMLRFRPTRALRQKYKIERNEVDEELTITKKYPAEFLVPASEDPRFPAKFLVCNYLGQETKLSTRESDLLYDIRGLKKTNVSLKAQLAYMHENYRKMTSEVPEYAQTWQSIQKAMTPKRDREEEEQRPLYGSAYPTGGNE